ncbi:hypothetical protein B7R54_01000 [Subtercola boreus]|uniref:Uncharacterized protein n=1 Tax=Subtercola boreus TaxID=120213 RepID=A0A3E0VGE9_9MICO|nr:hypothetical protein B7R54_01000 [Subtercola boreus]TQL55189.1 hypothetical protein FB464_2747 [Subtercola boreus]
MSQITSFQIVRDHLGLAPGVPRRGIRLWLELAILVAAVVVSVVVLCMAVRTNAVGALLTATSIMTGLTFTMAMRFWERSIDARSNPDLIFDEERKSVLDNMRTLLLWTVLAGLASTSWLAGLAIFVGTSAADPWATAVAAGLVAYQLLYVLRSIVELYWASYTLRP